MNRYNFNFNSLVNGLVGISISALPCMKYFFLYPVFMVFSNKMFYLKNKTLIPKDLLAVQNIKNNPICKTCDYESVEVAF